MRLLSNKGFSLVELSIVIVIIGLLIGSVVVGQNLIENSKLTSAAEEKARLTSATKLFQDKYYALPGDFKLAEGLWGTMVGCMFYSPTGLSSGTCNGNGDGQMRQAYERQIAWHHIALSGLMPLPYTGSHGPGRHLITAGENTPQSQWSNNAGWALYHVGNKVSDATYFDGQYNHILILGDGAINTADVGMLTPEQLLALDTKFDDGLADAGKIRGVKESFVNNVALTCVLGTDYDISVDADVCPLLWITGF